MKGIDDNLKKNDNQKISNSRKIACMIVYLMILSIMVTIKCSFSISYYTGVLMCIVLMFLYILKKIKK